MSIVNFKNKFISLSGIFGIVILWTGVGISMLIAHLHFIDTRPISYLGIDSRTSQLFSVTLILSAILFIIFGYFVRASYKVKAPFLVFLIIGQLGQLITAVSPYGHREPMRFIHTIAAFTLAFSLPFLINTFRLSQRSSTRYQLFTWLFNIELACFIVGISLFVFTKGIAPLGEALPALGFHLWVIVVTYVMIIEASDRVT